MLAVRIGEKYTVEEWKKKMESEGYQWKDFSDDLEGNKFKNWHSKNRRKVIVNHLHWHIEAPLLIFYKDNPNYVPTPDHPFKGKGKFKAIYLHDLYPMSEVSLVEAEIINVNANITLIEGAPLPVSLTTPSRLLTYDPEVYEALKTIREHQISSIARWEMMLNERQLSKISNPEGDA